MATVVDVNPRSDRKISHCLASWDEHYLRPGGFLLQLNHRAKYEEKRNEVGDDSHAHQDIVGPFHVCACLAQQNKQSRHPGLGPQGNVGSPPLWMKAAKGCGKELINPRNKRQSSDCGQPGSDSPQPANGDQERGYGSYVRLGPMRSAALAMACMIPCKSAYFAARQG